MPRRQKSAIARAVDLIKDGYLGIARAQKIGMKRMTTPRRIHGAGGAGQGLRQDLAAKDSLNRFGGRKTAKNILFDFFQIEQRQQPGQCIARHFCSPGKPKIDPILLVSLGKNRVSPSPTRLVGTPPLKNCQQYTIVRWDQCGFSLLPV
jgi:hypothetical protein